MDASSIAVIGGTVTGVIGAGVGIGGLVFARREGSDNRAQAAAIADSQREHDLDRDRRERNFQRAADVYFDLLVWLSDWVSAVVTSPADKPTQVDKPVETWVSLDARLQLFASTEVAAGTTEFHDRVRRFDTAGIEWTQIAARTTATLVDGGESVAANERWKDAMRAVTAQAEQVRQLVRDEMTKI
jgi:hypothetical protein